MSSPFRLAPQVRKATLVQDGHSLGEQALYDALWQHADEYLPDVRKITVGYRGMSALARMTVNNCKANILSLIEKAAVNEAEAFSPTQGRTYYIYGYKSIMERRRDLGYTHVIRSRGVMFVDPETGEPKVRRSPAKKGIPETGIPESLDFDQSGIPETGTPPVPFSDKSGIPFSGTPSNRQLIRQFSSHSTTSTTMPTGLLPLLRDRVPQFDRDAARMLWNACRSRTGDCLVEEIIEFVDSKMGMLQDGRIQNPVGFLLTAVPKCFDEDAVQRLRLRQAKNTDIDEERAKALREMEALRADMERTAADPEVDEEERRFARRMAAQLAAGAGNS